MSSLETLVDTLKRAVAVPGTFDANFPETTDDDLVASLLDGFAEAQLDGFFTKHEATDAGIVTPDLSRAQGALVALYTASRILESEIKNRKTHVRYEASGTVFEQDQSYQILVQLLKDTRERKIAILKQAQSSGAGSAFVMADNYFIRATSNYLNYGDRSEDRAYDYNIDYSPNGF
jgi:hypothetical protein